MPVGSVSTPSDANFSNADGTETHEGGPSGSSGPSGTDRDCASSVDELGNRTGDLADAGRDWLKGDASGRDVWDAFKEFGKAESDVVEDCFGY